MRSDLPTGTVTFLFTDIEGSTRLLHSVGPDAYAGALAEHRRVLREAFAAQGGIEVDTQGDAFFVAFPTAPGAAAAALAGQAALVRGPVRVRMGLHTGVPAVTAEGYVGVDVHRGARVAALANGGQIVVSPTTAALVDRSRLGDLGLHRLKDFESATRLHQLGPGEFPPLRTPGSVELPSPATRFLGRERELFEAVSVVLDHDPRVLTIVGPGGTGKTRFAIELARLLAEDADGGTLFVPLAPVREPALVPTVLAAALGAEGPEPAHIAARLGDRRTHILLDNLEQLLPGVADSLAVLTSAAPSLRLVVTSREALRIGAETQLDLPPLVVTEAVELFLARAHAVGIELEGTPVVHELCARLDYLPLAIELAAARTKLLRPEALLERLTARLDLPAPRDAEPRHATLRATIDWSYDLLDAQEQRLFESLAVFVGGCTLESAERVCEADLDTLASLIDKSLLRRRDQPDGADRYWMLETIREFAAERLDQRADAIVVRRRHAERALSIAEEAHLSPETGQGEQAQRHELVLADWNDIRSALDWAEENDAVLGLELVLALENFWSAHDPQEGTRRLTDMVARSSALPLQVRARVLRVEGNHAVLAGNADFGIARYEQSAAAYRALGDEQGEAIVAIRVARNLIAAGDVAGGRRLANQALDVARAGLPWLEPLARGVLGRAERADGDLASAYSLAREGAAGAHENGFWWWEARQLTEVLELALELGRLDDASDAGRRALSLASKMGDRLVVLWALTGLGLVTLQRGDHELAGRFWGAVMEDEERQPLELRSVAEFGAPLAAALDPRFLAGVESGRVQGLDAVVALALGEPQTEP